ncbi:MAG TPA: GWxTD domain-containing protein [Candidatus Krumholzibacteria bacterium]|nr:GWxTD domain-containing protein [Candidatus Krumholzibacteria bacterium]
MGALLALVASGVASAGATHLGRGDFDFHLDAASFRGREGRNLTEVSARVANSSLKFSEEKGGWVGKVKLSILVADDDGKEVVKESETMTFHETDRARVDSPVAYQTIVKQFNLPPGGYWLSFAIEDLQAPKVTVVGLTRGENKSSAVRRAHLNLPEMPADEPSFSDAMFVWDIDPKARGVRKYRPNPPRMYGLYRDTLTVYFELYLPESLASAPTFEFISEIVTPEGAPVRESRLTLPNPVVAEGQARAYPVVIREDLTAFTAGSYTLYLSFALNGETLARVRSGDFSVAWDIRTWEVPRREFLAEARFLMGDDDFKQFAGRSPGEQERILDELWKSLDPDPSTGTNEAYDVFIERLAYVEAYYTEGGPAIYTARGGVYVRFGPPDELVQDVIPLNYDTLAEAEAVVENPYHPLNLGSSNSKLYRTPKTRNSFATDGHESARYRPEDNTGVPYELWIYHAGGAPVLVRDRVQEMDIGMRFLFVDRDGHGAYKLERSSSISTK